MEGLEDCNLCINKFYPEGKCLKQKHAICKKRKGIKKRGR